MLDADLAINSQQPRPLLLAALNLRLRDAKHLTRCEIFSMHSLRRRLVTHAEYRLPERLRALRRQPRAAIETKALHPFFRAIVVVTQHRHRPGTLSCPEIDRGIHDLVARGQKGVNISYPPDVGHDEDRLGW